MHINIFLLFSPSYPTSNDECWIELHEYGRLDNCVFDYKNEIKAELIDLRPFKCVGDIPIKKY